MPWDVVASKEEIALLMEAGFIYRDAEKFQEARERRKISPESFVPFLHQMHAFFAISRVSTRLSIQGKLLKPSPCLCIRLPHDELADEKRSRGTKLHESIAIHHQLRKTPSK